MKTRALADSEWELQIGKIQNQKHYLAVLVAVLATAGGGTSL